MREPRKGKFADAALPVAELDSKEAAESLVAHFGTLVPHESDHSLAGRYIYRPVNEARAEGPAAAYRAFKAFRETVKTHLTFNG